MLSKGAQTLPLHQTKKASFTNSEALAAGIHPAGEHFRRNLWR
jgi:hypothetical protein